MALLTLRPIRSLDAARGVPLRSPSSDLRRGVSAGRGDEAVFAPPVDIFENEDSLTIVADLPGVDRSGIDVAIEGRTLTLSGERRIASESGGGRRFRTERRQGRFERVFTLPTSVDGGRITANYSDGVLRVVIPNAAESRPRRIAVRSA